MTSRNLNISNYNWQIFGKNIQSNYNTNLTLDASLNSKIYFNTNLKSVLIGNNLLNKSIDSSCVMTIGTPDLSTNTSINVYGSYYSYGTSAMQIPFDTSNNAPSGKSGYIRYNTTENLIYWFNGDPSSNRWLPINLTPPTYTSISPALLSEGVQTLYTINGTDFNSFTSVTFKGNVDNIIYSPSAGTTYVSGTQVTCTNTIAMSNANTNTGFFIIVTNTDTALNFTSPTADLTFNPGPTWVSPASNASVGTGFTSTTYDANSSPFSALVATDVNTPITYSLVGSISGAPSVTMNSSNGKLIGTTPATAGTYNFNARATDNLGALSSTRPFSFTLFTPQITVNSTTYNILSPQAFTTQGYYTLSVNTNMTLKCQLWGAGGAGANGNNGPINGAAGGYVEGRVSFASGTTYVFLVGQGGSTTPVQNPTNFTSTNAFPDGGNTQQNEGYGPGAGGGSTRIGPNVANSPASYNSPSAVYYLIAGAGGGGTDWIVPYYPGLTTPGIGGYGGYNLSNNSGTGGKNGLAFYPSGESSAACGGGGSQTAGGTAGSTPARLAYSQAGSKYQGGNGSGGGGGGGYYGGGGARGYYSQGGGGSSYYNPSFVTSFNYLDTDNTNYSTSPNSGIASNKPGNSGNGGNSAVSPSNAQNGKDGALIFTFIS